MDTGTAIAIELDVPGADKAIADLQRVAAELQKVSRVASSSGNSGGASGGNPASGGYFNFQNFQQSQHHVQVFNTRINQASKSTSAAVLNIQKMARAAGVGGPLIAALENPVTAVIAGVGAATAAFANMTQDAIKAAAALRDIGLTSGGTKSESSQLSVLGNALGVDMGALSREFADRISRPGAAAGLAASQGIHDYGALDPSLNKAEKLLDAIKAMDHMSEAQATQFARIEGLEPALKLRGLSDQTKQNLNDVDPAMKSVVMNEQTMKDMAELQVAIARTEAAFLDLEVALVEHFIVPLMPLLDGATLGFQLFAASLSNNVEVLDGSSLAIRGIWESLIAQITHNSDMAIEATNNFVQGMMKMQNATNAEKDARKRSTDSLNGLADAADRAQRNGIFGGGERARGAVPSHWMGMNAGSYLGEARRLGAFNL